MQRKLFKFATLNSFKMVWMVSIVLFTCVIANAQILQTGKDHAMAPCIDSIRVLTFTPDSITVSLTPGKFVKGFVNLKGLFKWDYNPWGGGKDWVRADGRKDGRDIAYSPSESIGGERGIKIESSRGVALGDKFQLNIQALMSDNGIQVCTKKFVVAFKPFKSLNNLRLRGPKKPKLPQPPDLLGRPKQ